MLNVMCPCSPVFPVFSSHALSCRVIHSRSASLGIAVSTTDAALGPRKRSYRAAAAARGSVLHCTGMTRAITYVRSETEMHPRASSAVNIPPESAQPERLSKPEQQAVP